MKKIVSTMFKCGAIFASINTVWGGGDKKNLPPSSMQDVESLKRQKPPKKRLRIGEKPLSPGTQSEDSDGSTSDSSTEDFDNIYLASSGMQDEKSLNPPQKRLSFDDFLSKIDEADGKDEKRIDILNALYEVIKNRKDGINLHPGNIFVECSTENKILEVGIASSEKTYQLMQFDQPREVLACLVLYVMKPDLRSCFRENKIRIISDGESDEMSDCGSDKYFQILGSKGWSDLKVSDACTAAAFAFLNMEVLFEDILDLLKNSTKWFCLIHALEDSIYEYSLAERDRARRIIKECWESSSERFIEIVYYIKRFQCFLSELLWRAEACKLDLYLSMSKNAPKVAEELEQIILRGRIQVSQDTKKIIFRRKPLNLEGVLSNVPLTKLSEGQRLRLLLVIAKKIQENDKCSDGYSLYPTGIFLRINHSESFVEFPKTDLSSLETSNTYRVMQVVGDSSDKERRESRQRAFACLLIYVMVPEFRPWFAGNYVNVICGCFTVCNPYGFDCYAELPFDNDYVKLANLIIQGKINVVKKLELLEKIQLTVQDIISKVDVTEKVDLKTLN